MPLKVARKSHALTCDKSKALDTGAARRPAQGRLQARLRRRQHRLAVQISDPRRRLLFQRRLLRPARQTRDRAEAICRHRHFRRRGREDEERRDRCRRPHRARDRLSPAGRAGAKAVRRGRDRRASARSGVLATTQELRNMYVRTGQPGLWFIAGGLAQCRIGSKQLALQIKAIEEGHHQVTTAAVIARSGATKQSIASRQETNGLLRLAMTTR